MVMYLDETNPVENAPVGLETTRRKIMAQGVRLFENFYFHKALTNFRGDEVEVRYDVRDFSRVSIVLPDFRVVEADTIAVFRNDGEPIDGSVPSDALELIRVKATNRLLVAELWQSLELRGLFFGDVRPAGACRAKKFRCASDSCKLKGKFGRQSKKPMKLYETFRNKNAKQSTFAIGTVARLSDLPARKITK